MARSNNFTTINEFTAGVNTDLDEHRIRNNQYQYLLNGEVIEFSGKTGVLTNKNGNKYEFSITDGFIPLSYKVHNGIAYIISMNEITGEGEVGVFPSPNAYFNQNNLLTGFTREYSPLWNFTGANNDQHTTPTRQYFRTTLFGFNKLMIPKIVIREDYDRSVNIYFVDGLNTDKVINSGFDSSSGAVLDSRCYGNNSFPCVVEILNESSFHPKVDTVSLDSGGKIKTGNYKFFFRYTTNDYNPTSFLCETNMVMITDIELTDTVGASGHVASYTTNKLVNINLKDLDPGYRYIEVGYIRYVEETFNAYIVDKRFEINPATLECSILVNGTEATELVDLSAIIVKKSNLKISSSITDADERLFRSDLRQKYKHNDDLLAYAQAIIPSEDFVTLGNPMFNVAANIGSGGMYSNWENVYYYTGYFSCEAYPFAVVFVFNDGTESAAYPIKGVDKYNNSLTQNNSGVFRFPDHLNRAQPIYDSTVQLSFPMGIKFDCTAANTVRLGSSFIQNNIKGLYFVRGERSKNLLYQGVSLNIYTGEETHKQTWADKFLGLLIGGLLSSSDTEFFFSKNYAPFLDEFGFYPEIPCKVQTKSTQLWGLAGKSTMEIYDVTDKLVANERIIENVTSRKGFFSLDHFFKRSLPKEKYYISRISAFGSYANTAPNPANYILTQSHFVPFQYISPVSLVACTQANCNQQLPWNKIPLNGYVSYFEEGSPTDVTSLAYCFNAKTAVLSSSRYSSEVLTLAMGINAYIGLTFDNGAIGNNFAYSLLNLYTNEPLSIDISEIVDTKNTNYQKISGFIEIDTLTGTTPLMFNGDCFIQRVSQKVLFNPNRYPTSLKDDNFSMSELGGLIAFNVSKSKYISFGTLVEYVAEFELNHGVRLTNGNQTYFPQATPQIFWEYASKNVLEESNAINLSYSRTDSYIKYLGFNYDLPVQDSYFPTRIMGSNNHILNGFKDGYRNFGLATYRDYDYSHGRIVDIQTLLGTLVCIMEHHIGMVPINERTAVASTSGELLIGFGDLLPVKQNSLSQKAGSQQRCSIVNTGHHIFGLDWSLRKFWKVSINQVIEYISDSKSFSNWTHKVINTHTNSYSDVVVYPNNSPYDTTGINSGFDEKYGDVYWTISYQDGNVVKRETICFSEKADYLKGWYSFTPNFYMTIGEDFYTVNNIITEDADVNNGFWLHDDVVKCTFYGVLHKLILRFVSADKPDLTKIYDNVYINSNGEVLFKLEYETLTQLSDHFPFIKTLPLEKYLQPEYKEDKWRVPINRCVLQKVMDNGTNLVKSKMRGNWIKISIEYEKNVPIFIKSILTEYNISNH